MNSGGYTSTARRFISSLFNDDNVSSFPLFNILVISNLLGSNIPGESDFERIGMSFFSPSFSSQGRAAKA
jgi:hypothetical protein